MKHTTPLLSLAILTAALCSLSTGAGAATVFDAVTGGQGSYNQSFTGTGGNPSIAELGDIITLAGTDRLVDSATIRMAQQTFTGSAPYAANITLSLYSVNTATLATSLISALTSTVEIPSTGIFDVNYDFNNVAVPTTFYYGISVSSTFQDVSGLRVVLWDYWSQANSGDGQTLPVGTDPGTVVTSPTEVSSIVYGRLASNPSQLVSSTNNGLGVNDLGLGFTPSVQIVAVPEPETYALMALGLVAVGAVARRRKQA